MENLRIETFDEYKNKIMIKINEISPLLNEENLKDENKKKFILVKLQELTSLNIYIQRTPQIKENKREMLRLKTYLKDIIKMKDIYVGGGYKRWEHMQGTNENLKFIEHINNRFSIIGEVEKSKKNIINKVKYFLKEIFS
ncbi:MAG: hypothetical protein HRU03_00850 [Nanoarchaeales archaeon]|nr:hypothetical protein [Nanoarchaeales archaeon]